MTDEPTIARLLAEMRARHGVPPGEVRLVFSPYRICPLGAHVDHQLGRVTAMAIDRGTLLAWAPSGSAEVRLASLAFPGEVRFRVDAGPPVRQRDWGDYARGAAAALAARTGALGEGIVGVTSAGLIDGGLSSSASVGIAYLLALEAANGRDLSLTANIGLDQAIENGYLGLANGILDQAAILAARRDHLAQIDCRAFAEAAEEGASGEGPAAGIELLPRPAAMPPFAVLVAFSGVARALVATDYNRRVEECREAARSLLAAAGRPSATPLLGHVTAAEYRQHAVALSGPPARRAEHFFSEQRRVADGVAAWRAGDLAAFGRLVTDSGRSSIDCYECGSPPLVDLWEILVRAPGVHGARFSGAGFRGCCVALVDPEAAAEAAPAVLAAYAARQPGLAARAAVHLCTTDDGARPLCRR